MKTKFETNVAFEIPKTKLREPKLPWNVTDEDIKQVKPSREDSESAADGAVPFKTRAIFPIMLLLTIFAILAYLVFDAAVKSNKMQSLIASKEKEASLLRQDFDKIADEKAALGEGRAQLEKRVNELSAQKELFTAVIESLTKKGDEVE